MVVCENAGMNMRDVDAFLLLVALSYFSSILLGYTPKGPYAAVFAYLCVPLFLLVVIGRALVNMPHLIEARMEAWRINRLARAEAVRRITGKSLNVQHLRGYLGSRDSKMRKLAFKTLCKVDDGRKYDIIAWSLVCGGLKWEPYVMKGLRKLGRPMFDCIVTQLYTSSPRTSSIYDSVNNLARAINWKPTTDPEECRFQISTRQFGKLRRQEALDVLILALRQAAPDIQGEAALILGEIGDAKAFDDLIWALDFGVGNAARSLGRLGDKRAIPSLERKLEEKEREAEFRQHEMKHKYAGDLWQPYSADAMAEIRGAIREIKARENSSPVSA